MKLFVVNNWMDEVNINKPRANWSVILIKKILGNINIQKNEKGKPFIMNKNQFINWAHTNDYLVIALSELGQVGVDIEVSHLPYEEQLHGWVLHKEEKYKLAQGRLFSEIWTRKEAILKCTGEGISDNMCELNSYKIRDLNVRSIFLSEVCISVCSEYWESVEIVVVQGAQTIKNRETLIY